MMKKICHLTSVHPRYDTRIFVKECNSLTKIGYDVSLVVADNKGNENKDGIKIFDVGKEKTRFKRILKTRDKVFKKALELDADIYHFHDPELIFIGKKLIKKKKKVIYDVHEDVPRQILSKPYLNGFTKPILSKIIEFFENRTAKKFSAIITATDFIKDRFLKYNHNSVSIKNYPIFNELKTDMEWSLKKNQACYVGAIAKTRGIKEIYEALSYTDYKFNLAGKFTSDKLKDDILKSENSGKINFYGFANRELVKKIYEKSKVGLVTLHPTISYIDALPVKMFEYMLAGIPVIASNIPLWKGIIEESKCGIVVNPYKPKEIADAINQIIENDDLAKTMGENGKRAVVEKYNWAKEEVILSKIYNDILFSENN